MGSEWLSRAIVQAVSKIVQAVHRANHAEKFEFSRDLYMRVSGQDIQLASLAIDHVQGMQLSIDEARRIVKSVERACAHRTTEEIQVGDLRWKTDARGEPGAKQIVVEFDGPPGFTRTPVERMQTEAAVRKFVQKFG